MLRVKYTRCRLVANASAPSHSSSEDAGTSYAIAQFLACQVSIALCTGRFDYQVARTGSMKAMSRPTLGQSRRN
jgi:hypothetical protein